MHSLVVEDDPLQATLTCNWLAARGHGATRALTGRAAIEAVSSRSFDVLILDWMLPDMSGQDVLAWVRDHGLAMPVVFATACSSEFEIASILDLGADDFLTKPLRGLELVARVEAVARRATRAIPSRVRG
jgi:two-component system response regulator RegX3